MKFFYILIVYLLIVTSCFSQQIHNLVKDTTDSNSIVRKTHAIHEIEVRAKMSLANVKSGSMGLSVDIQELKKLPNIMGDSDPFKSLQYMGGISQSGDASANMNVRGGNNDQNLILLNNCNIQNPTHVLGLFSVFNPDLIDQMKYIKTGIPAEYGGRLSSVIDIKNTSAIPEKTSVDGSVGLIASRITIKHPFSDNLSIYASHRASYIGNVVMPVLVKLGVNPTLAQNSFEFSDTNIGFNYVLKPKTRIAAHFYVGNDRISIAEDIKYSLADNSSKWGNKAFGLQLSHLFSDKWSMTHNLNFTQFYLNTNVNWINNTYSLKSLNSMLVYRTDFVYLIRMHSLKFGTELALNKTLPANIAKTSLDTAQNQPQPFFNQTSDVALYVRDEWEVGRFLFNAGIRTNIHFKQALNNEYLNLSERMNISKSYWGFEPRFYNRIMLTESSSLKIAASRHYQYFSRLQVVNFGIPLEIFVTASENIKPTSVWHFSGGYFKNFNRNKWEFSVEAYYKSYANLLEYGGNLTDLFAENEMLNKIYNGKGWAYGTELMLKKNTGRFTGWASYTLGWNYRMFDKINNGRPYLATTDRRHDLSLIGFYKLTKDISLSATFVYATGSRLNLPRSWFVIDDKVILEYSKYNAFTMPDYNRLDISVNYKLRPVKNINSELNFSVYNIYNRANPFQVYFSTQSENNSYNYKIKMSYLIPILPTLSWTFHI